MSLFKLKKVVYNSKDSNTSLKLLISKLDIFICSITNFIPKKSLNIQDETVSFCLRFKGIFIAVFLYYNYVYLVYVQYTAFQIILTISMKFTTFLDFFTQFKLFQKEVVNFLGY